MRCRNSARWGFSIIDLLVVLAIIVLAISILVPEMVGARDQARYTKWQAFNYLLRQDKDICLLYDFQDQDGTQTDAKGNLKAWNRAQGDPFTSAQNDYEPEVYDAIFGALWPEPQMPLHAPDWTWSEARWKGKGGAIFRGPDKDTMGTSNFNGIEWPPPPPGGEYTRDFCVTWTCEKLENGGNNQFLWFHDNRIGAVNGCWGRWLFMETGANGTVKTSTGNYDASTGIQVPNAAPTDEQFYVFSYCHKADGTAKLYVNGELLQEKLQPNPDGEWGGFFVGETAGNLQSNAIYDSIFIDKTVPDEQKIKDYHQVNMVRKKK